MAQITESVSALAQDIGGTVVTLAQDAASAAGELGANLVDSGLRLLQDSGVVEKPKSNKKIGFLALFIIIVGGLVAFKVVKGRRSSPSHSPTFSEANRLADSTGVAVGD